MADTNGTGKGRKVFTVEQIEGMNRADKFLLECIQARYDGKAWEKQTPDNKGKCLAWLQRIEARIASRVPQSQKSHGDFSSIF